MLRTVKAISVCATSLLFGCSANNGEPKLNSRPPAATTTIPIPATTIVPHQIGPATRRVEIVANYVLETGLDVDMLIDGGVVEPNPDDQCVTAVSVVLDGSAIYLTPRIAANIPDINSIEDSVHLDVDTGGQKNVDIDKSDLTNAPVIRQATAALLTTAKEGCRVWAEEIAPGL